MRNHLHLDRVWHTLEQVMCGAKHRFACHAEFSNCIMPMWQRETSQAVPEYAYRNTHCQYAPQVTTATSHCCTMSDICSVATRYICMLAWQMLVLI